MQLYKRDCDLCGKSVVSRYSSDKKYIVYCPSCWWSDDWYPIQYGRDYDFSKPFFVQFDELFHEVPLLGLSVDLLTAKESPYTNNVANLKECYLLFESDYCERSLYGYYFIRSNDCVDMYFNQSCELSYDAFHSYELYKCIHADYTLSTRDSAFLWRCLNCTNCFEVNGSENCKYTQ